VTSATEILGGNAIKVLGLIRIQMDKYLKGKEAGRGAFGIVYKAKRKTDGREVAIKKIRMGDRNDGVNFTALREIKILQELKHPNIIELVDVFLHNKNVCIVFEWCVTDLEIVINDKSIGFSAADVKSYMKMVLSSVEFLHKNWVLHRDLKPGNLLITREGVLKLADFGFGRKYGSPNERLTHTVVTRWYRAPELLFRAQQYGYGVDIWSVGCIFAELMLRLPYFAGASDIDQLSLIFAALGTPTEEQWPGMKELPDYVEYSHCEGTPFDRQLFRAASEDALDLLSKMLKYDPNSRVTSTEARNHPYFTSPPEPTPPGNLPLPQKRGKKK